MTLWAITHQAPLSKGFSRQEYWSGLPCPPPTWGLNLCLLCLLHSQLGSLPPEPCGKPSYKALGIFLNLLVSQFSQRQNEDILVPVCCVCTQSCPTLCDPMDCSPPGSSVHRILQASILGCGLPFPPRGSSRPRRRTQVPCTAGRFFTAEPPRKPSWYYH